MEQGHEDKGVREIYEIGYHLVPTLSEEDVALRVGDIQKLVSTHDGNVIGEEFPQMTDLAYTMRKMIAGKWEKYDTAYFGWIKFDTTSTEAQALNEDLRALDFVLRFILVKTVREAPVVRMAPKKEVAEKPKKEGGEKPISPEEVDKAIDELVKE